MLGKKHYIVPIPGSRKVERIRENLGAAKIALTVDEVKKIDAQLDEKIERYIELQELVESFQ